MVLDHKSMIFNNISIFTDVVTALIKHETSIWVNYFIAVSKRQLITRPTINGSLEYISNQFLFKINVSHVTGWLRNSMTY